ncbi:MAG: hypothetical protein ACI4HI_10825 [Lachnospiraceae bacterium]
MKKKVLAVLMAVAMVGGVTGCQKEDPKQEAADNVQALCDLIIRQDDTKCKELKLEDEELKNTQKLGFDAVKEGYKTIYSTSGIPAEEDQIEELANAQIDLWKKVSIEVTPDEEKSTDEAVYVTVKSSSYDQQKIFTDAATKATEEVKAEGYTDQAKALDALGDSLTEHLLEELKNTEINTDDEKSISVKCTKQDAGWLPEDTKDLGNQMGKMITGQ